MDSTAAGRSPSRGGPYPRCVAGRLILCAGPIGNLGDAAPRLGTALREATLVYAEDTRRTRILLDHLGVATPLRSYFVGNEAERSVELQRRLAAGGMALLTNTGTGDRRPRSLRCAAIAAERDHRSPARVRSRWHSRCRGAPDRFVFEEFSRKGGRTARIAGIAAETRTTVFFKITSAGRRSADLAGATTVPRVAWWADPRGGGKVEAVLVARSVREVTVSWRRRL